MRSPIINTLFGTPAAATTAKAQPASGTAFGEMLSRELGSRQVAQAVPVAQTAPAPQHSTVAERSPAPPRQSPPAAASGADAANAAGMRARMEGQRAQERRDSNARADAADKAKTTANVAGDDANRTPTPGATGTDRSTGKSADKADGQVASTDEKDTSGAADEAAGAATPGTASAALIALVNSMAPRATVPADAASATGDAAVDPKLAAQKGAARLPGVAGDIAEDAASQSDPAFDALLAQAAHATQAREAARGTGTGTAADLSRGLPDAANPTAGRAPALPTELAARAEAAILPTAAQAAFERDAAGAAGGALSQTNVAVGTAATAGVLPASDQAASESLAPRVGTPAWDNALGQKVVWMAAGAEQSASLTLNPPDLGPLQVVINVTNSHAEATFTAAQPEVRQALEAAMPKLKEMLADAGISLGQTSVGAGSTDQGGAQAQQQARRSGNGRGNDDGAVLAAPVRSTRIITGGNGLVDTFA